MGNVKEFCKKHKKELILTGVVVGAVVTGLLIKGRAKRELLDVTGKNWITWKPGNDFGTLERAKEILDLNAGNAEALAIVKVPSNEDKYICVLLSENVITSKAV